MKRAAVGFDGPTREARRHQTSSPSYLNSSDTSGDESDIFLGAARPRSCGFGACARPERNGGRRKKSQEENDDDVNKVIVKELNALSLKDRERMYEEIHGVVGRDGPDLADTEQIDAILEEMQQAIENIPKKPAYEQARFLRPAYVTDRDLLIMMLRTDDYDVKKAATRLVRFFEFKLEWYGLDCLVRDITQDDLTEGMLDQLYKGYIQVLSRKDRSGRTVQFATEPPDADWKSHLGMAAYVTMYAVREPEPQKQGLVCVFRATSHTLKVDVKGYQTTVAMNQSLPAKCTAFHWCYNNPKLKPFITAYQSIADTSVRLRSKFHFGTPMENMYGLMSFGLTPDMLPYDIDGNLDSTDWRIQMEAQREFERAKRSVSTVVIPTQNDVLFGRGYPYQRFPGNVYLAGIVERNRERRSLEASRKRKTNIVRGIIQYIKEIRGGRFLKRAEDGESWEVVSSGDEVLRKVAHSFRAPVRKDLITNEASEEFEGFAEIILVPCEHGGKKRESNQVSTPMA